MRAFLQRVTGTSATELVYRKQIRPVVEDGAVTMDRLFPTGDQDRARHSYSVSHQQTNQAPCQLRPGQRIMPMTWP